DFLLTALTETLGPWSESDTIALDLEGHGREDILACLDVSRTVGWFTSIFPICLQCPFGAEPGAALKSIKEQLRAIPNRGISYGLLRYLGAPDLRKELEGCPQPQIQFDYLGQFDNVVSESSIFALETKAACPYQDARNLRRYIHQVNASVSSSLLYITWSH